MQTTVISGDIISSTSLLVNDRAFLEDKLKTLLKELENKFDVFGRLIKGDYVECVVPNPQDSLRVALIIKSFIKSIVFNNSSSYKNNSKIKIFRTHGIRLAIGYGELTRFDREKGIIDGEAIYLSGRTINKETAHNKERIIIKNTLFFLSNNDKLNREFDPLLSLIDVLISKATSKQSEVLYLKLMHKSEEEIALKLNITQSGVNKHSTNLGWNSIEKAVDYFNYTITNNH